METGSTLSGLPELLTVAEVAKALRVSVSAVSRYARDGVLESVRVGGAIRFRREDIERILRGERAS